MHNFSLQQSNYLKAIAILMMLGLHLFNRDYNNLFEPLIFIGSKPLSYYISLFCDACVPIFAFVSGYGLYFKYQKDSSKYVGDHGRRLKKLYINYWVIIALFPVALGLILGEDGYPGSFVKLFLNITAIDPSYNGAWWFFTTYVLFVLTSKFWFKFLDRLNPYLFFIALGIFYLVSFYFRIYKTEIFNSTVLQWVHRQAALYFCTLFQFMLGAFALKYNWKAVSDKLFNLFRNKNLWALLGMILLIVFHAFVPNFIVAPFIGIGFIFLFLQMNLPNSVNQILDYLAPHATNLWLVHMFFYMIFFSEFVYRFHYVLLIYIVLIALCLVSSYIINYFVKILQKWV
ncbi:acyltransferase [Kaistella haifensis]|nr:acyltransferase [Kaistella haifensis]